MSQAPSTLGTMTTSSFSPISVTSVVRSSSTQGLSSELTRVQRAVWPKSDSLAALTRPWRAASLRSTGIASSRLPSRMSVLVAMSAALATIFSLEKSRKWIIRDGLTGISLSGSGAPIASGWKKSLGVRKTLLTRYRGGGNLVGRGLLPPIATVLSQRCRALTVTAPRIGCCPRTACHRLSTSCSGGSTTPWPPRGPPNRRSWRWATLALDAAGQSRRAAEAALRSAELAEQASRAVQENGRRATTDRRSGEARMQSFSERADRVVARLRALERLPA